MRHGPLRSKRDLSRPCSCDERSVLEVRENWAVLHESFKKAFLPDAPAVQPQLYDLWLDGTILPTGSGGSRRRRIQAFRRCQNELQYGNYQMAAGTNTTHRQPEWPPQVAIAKNHTTTRRKQPPSMRRDRRCVRQEEERALYAAAMLQQRRGLRVHTATHFGYRLSAMQAQTSPASVAEFSCNSSHPQRPHPTFNLARMKTGASRNWRRYETRSIVPLLSPPQRDFADCSCSDFLSYSEYS